jgi:hypothetical protein
MIEPEMPQQTPKSQIPPLSRARWAVIGIAITSAIFAALYDTGARLGFVHTSMMFIGIPAILAILLAMTPQAKSATGAITKGITFVLLIMAPLVGEGVVCILMAAPIFYFVGVSIGALVDWQRKKRAVTLSCCALVLLPMSLEGVVPALTFGRLQTVAVTRVVNGTPAEVREALAMSPRLATPLPGLFPKIGFPRPLEARGEGLEIGDTRTIHFAGVEDAPPGDVVMRVSESRAGFARFDAVSDSTKLGKWLHWDDSQVTWVAVDGNHTAVTWKVQFERELDPAWYWSPWERLAVHNAAAFLIEANATPVRQ